MTPHLTHEQLCDMILARSPHPLSSDFAALQHHLGACPSCTAELASLRSSLALFREASTSYSQQQLTQLRANNIPVVRKKTIVQPIYWAAAAAALCIATMLPITLHRQNTAAPIPSTTITQPAPSSQSDEALLEEINQELSDPIPSPMRPLADPTASSATTPSTSSQRN